jgi:uridine kinase
MPTRILQQDDYFVLPPKSNDSRRREDISWVGMQEVKLQLLDQHLEAARTGKTSISKPLVDFQQDRISSETLSLEGVQVLIAEGTYTTMLHDVDTKVFIDRSYHDTLEARKRRGREKLDPFLEQVLEIEHRIIASHRAYSDLVITTEYTLQG